MKFLNIKCWINFGNTPSLSQMVKDVLTKIL